MQRLKANLTKRPGGAPMLSVQHDGQRLAISCVLDSTPQDVRNMLCRLRDELAPVHPEMAADGTWEIVLAEVLNNVVEHAYGDRSGGEIRLSLVFCEETLKAEVTDFGCPMPDGQLPDGQPADLDVPAMDLPEGGFGWFLIRTLATKLLYVHEGTANKLTLELRLTEDQGAVVK
jgi:serine/threonine-protein kinase RsbW